MDAEEETVRLGAVVVVREADDPAAGFAVYGCGAGAAREGGGFAAAGGGGEGKGEEEEEEGKKTGKGGGCHGDRYR